MRKSSFGRAIVRVLVFLLPVSQQPTCGSGQYARYQYRRIPSLKKPPTVYIPAAGELSIADTSATAVNKRNLIPVKTEFHFSFINLLQGLAGDGRSDLYCFSFFR